MMTFKPICGILYADKNNYENEVTQLTREEKIIAYMSTSEYIPLTIDELSAVLCVPKEDFSSFCSVINSLILKNKIRINKKGRLKPCKERLVICRFQKIANGSGFAAPEDGSEELFILSADASGALTGDTVSVRVTKKSHSPDKKSEGEIVSVLKRAHTKMSGNVKAYGKYLYLESDDPDIDFSLRLTKFPKSLMTGDKAVAKIERYPSYASCAEGSIIKILGRSGDNKAEILSIASSFSIENEFDEDALREADSVSESVKESELENRRDFTGDRVITIDGDDSRDFDDAVCIKKSGEGYTLFVHIADVSHYVKENSFLDRSAFSRGTSVYFPNMVIPMLPEKLSNGICSLNEGEIRLTLSIVMNITKNGDVSSYEIVNGYIRSLHRMTYSNVEKILECDRELSEKYADIKDDLFLMAELAAILNRKRAAMGSIDFDIAEPMIVLGEDLVPTSVLKREIGKSNKIIEEFMLIANCTAAQYARDKNLPFVYRIHEAPDKEKIENLNAFLKSRSLSEVKNTDKITPLQMKAVIDEAADRSDSSVINARALRAMMKAKYSRENLGHFGLASSCYCHFTSPIRRYPDLFIHRIIKESLISDIDEKRTKYLSKAAEDAAENSSTAERAATDAEREADKYFICLYMKNFIGEKFEAVIQSITDFAVFVSIFETIEGAINLSLFSDDYYEYDQKSFSLIGKRNKKVYRIGDKTDVRLISADERGRRIDFAPSDMPEKGKQFTKRASKAIPKKKSNFKMKKFVSKKSKKRR